MSIEAAYGESAVPRLRRIALIMGVGTLLVLALDAWTFSSLWSLYGQLARLGWWRRDVSCQLPRETVIDSGI